jgi:hypothetical protein
MLEMPAKAKKNVPAKAKKSAHPADDFDDMLADFKAQDLQENSYSAESNSGSTTTTTTAGAATRRTKYISDMAIFESCSRRDMAQLCWWARRDFRVSSAEPLFQCICNRGGLDLVRLLVKELGADVNEANKDGFMPLVLAATMENFEMVKFLVMELGADVNKVGEQGVKSTALLMAVTKNQLDMVVLLLELTAIDVNQGDRDGNTPLMAAAEKGFLSIVRILLLSGADIDGANATGGTALMAAAINERFDVVMVLVKEGANTQATSTRWGTAADVSKYVEASDAQTAFLEAHTQPPQVPFTNFN